jgi:predicted ATPase
LLRAVDWTLDMPAISKLSITGYKSIRELREFELRDLNVLIGANGAGKSNFISFFRMLAEMYGKRFQLYTAKRGGPDALLHFGRKISGVIESEVAFSHDVGQYFFTLDPTEDNRLILAQEGVKFGDSVPIPFARAGLDESVLADRHKTVSVPDASYAELLERLPPIGNIRVYHFHDTGEAARIKQVQPSNDNLRLKDDASNLAPFLRMLREKHEASYRMIVESIRMIAPFFDDFVHREGNPETVTLEWIEKGNPDTPFKVHALSDGTLRFICLATLLQQPWELMPPIILLDEPELGLHPFAINILAALLQRASERKQLIVATQSVELLSCFEPEDVVVIDRKDNASTFRRLDRAELGDWLNDYSLGALWEKNVLGGRPA